MNTMLSTKMIYCFLEIVNNNYRKRAHYNIKSQHNGVLILVCVTIQASIFENEKPYYYLFRNIYFREETLKLK